MNYNNSNYPLHLNNHINDQYVGHKLGIDRADQKLIGLLLKGYSTKNIALHENSEVLYKDE